MTEQTPQGVPVDTNADGTTDVVAYDLDEDSAPDTVLVDTNADGTADVVAFDLDEDSVPETIIADTNADGVADVVAVDQAAAAAFELDDDSSLEPTVPAQDQQALEDDSLTTPPDDISQADVEQAADDLEHTQLMGDYMASRGVIDY